jgi:uncharacterized protein (DUF697 family)/tellurite resistance protein
MNPTEQEAIAVIALAAALSDGAKSDAERDEVKEIFANLQISNPTGLIQQVLFQKTTWENAVDQLAGTQSRQLAFELAVCVCEADGIRNEAESQFLATLGSRLGLGDAMVQPVLAQADAIAQEVPLPVLAHPPLAEPDPSPAGATPASLGVAPMPESSIRNTAILAGALELLPQSMATMVIVPLQTHLVYRVGRHYGFQLDGGHVKEFLAVGGLGLASQALEGIARKFLGGLAKKAGGRQIGGLVSGATGPVMTFATTYALGKLADHYYGQGRKLQTDQMRSSFQSMLGQAQSLGQSLLPQIRARSSSLNPFDLAKIAQGTLVQ